MSAGIAAEADDESLLVEVAPSIESGPEKGKSPDPTNEMLYEGDASYNISTIKDNMARSFGGVSGANASQQNRYYAPSNVTVEVTDNGTFVEYKKGSETLHIYKGRCGAPPTFAFPKWSPFGVLLEPTLSTRSAAELEGVSFDGWKLPDAVWAFRPTSSQKVNNI